MFVIYQAISLILEIASRRQCLKMSATLLMLNRGTTHHSMITCTRIATQFREKHLVQLLLRQSLLFTLHLKYILIRLGHRK